MLFHLLMAAGARGAYRAADRLALAAAFASEPVVAAAGAWSVRLDARAVGAGCWRLGSRIMASRRGSPAIGLGRDIHGRPTKARLQVHIDHGARRHRLADLGDVRLLTRPVAAAVQAEPRASHGRTLAGVAA